MDWKRCKSVLAFAIAAPLCIVACGEGTTPEDDGGTGGSPSSVTDLLITEIMRIPVTVEASRGQWFELHNPGTSPFELNGCVIEDLETNTHTISPPSGSLVAPPGGYLVFGPNDVPDENGGISVDYVYTGVDLSYFRDGQNEIILRCGGTEIDRVVWDRDFPNISGVSMTLDPDLFDSELNDLASSWCGASTIIPFEFGGDTTAFGTPGAPNDDCT